MREQRWRTGATDTDRFAYGYNRDAERLYRQNLLSAAFSELYHGNGPTQDYDPFGQLTAFARGVLSDSNGDGIPDTAGRTHHEC